MSIAVGHSPGRAISRFVAGIVCVSLLVVASLIAHKYRRTSLVEMAAVGIVAVDVESPGPRLPCERTIEVGKSHILVVLIGGQDILEVCVTAVPPATKNVIPSVNTHQVVQVDLIDCIILGIRQVQLPC